MRERKVIKLYKSGYSVGKTEVVEKRENFNNAWGLSKLIHLIQVTIYGIGFNFVYLNFYKQIIQ